MQSAINTFRNSVSRVRHLGALYKSFQNILTSAVDSTDILRAQFVLAVSALDHFVHEVTVQGMCEIIVGGRTPTDAFRKFKTSCHVVLQVTNQHVAFEEDIREKHGFLSFQQPEKIADAIRLFFDKPIWRVVAQRLGKDENILRSELRLIVDRRNKIAHEADVDPSYPGARWPISSIDCDGALDLIESICEAIYAEVKI